MSQKVCLCFGVAFCNGCTKHHEKKSEANMIHLEIQLS